MTDGKRGRPPGPNKPLGPKGFLGEDSSLELDEWDATFDALHGGPDESANLEPVMDWPAAEPSVGDKTDLVDAGATMVQSPDFASELDEQLTLDGAIEDASFDRAPSMTMVDNAVADPMETDFSDVGADEAPSALGEMLGRSGSHAAVDEEGQTRVHGASAALSPRLNPDSTLEVDDDEIYTSASRPAAPPALDDLSGEDPLAPPPVVAPRRGPAIVRRATPTSGGGIYGSGFEAGAESTKIIHQSELDEHTEASRSTRQRATTRETLPPPIIDEDDYADIEIEADAKPSSPSAPSAAPMAVEAAPSSATLTGAIRRTAHTVRRPEGTQRSGSITMQPIAEAEVAAAEQQARATSAPGEEDDFSDVAAALGAEAAAEQVVAAAAALTPGNDPGTARPPSLDDTLGSFDEDEKPTRAASIETTVDLETSEERRPTSIRDIAADADPVEGRTGAADGGSLERAATTELVADGPIDRPSQRPPALTDILAPTPRDLDDSDRPTGIVEVATSPRAESRAESLEIDIDEDPELDEEPAAVEAPAPSASMSARVPSLARASRAIASTPPEDEPRLDLEAAGKGWPEQAAPIASATLDEECARMLLVYEREVSTLDESDASAALRIEAGRLSERLNDAERARAHYDAALMADPRATAALRGLRRIARASGDLVEATRQIDAEIAVAGALERRPLGHYRVDLLMASGEQDMARVAVGELLDSAPSDVRALLAHLELAFLDGRTDELGAGLEQLAHAVTDPELRAAVQSARGVLSAHHNDAAGAIGWFQAAAESDPTALAARLGAVRHAAGQADGESTAAALLELARQVEAADPTTAAAAALRAAQWSQGDIGAAAIQLARSAMPTDPLVVRVGAELALEAGDPVAAGVAFAAAAKYATAPAERAYAAARAAELDPGRGMELWAAVLAEDPGDDYAAAQLRTAHVAAEATQAAIDVDLTVASDPERDRARLRAAYGLIAQGQTDAAIETLAAGRTARPNALAIAEALGEALAGAGKWLERAKLFAELAADPGEQLDRELAHLRSALAWEEAVGAAAATAGEGDATMEQSIAELRSAIREALAAWDRVIAGSERAPTTGSSGEPPSMAPTAHAATMVLASRLGDRDVLEEILARAQAAERSPWAAASLGLRRARLAATSDLGHGEAILRDLTVVSPGGVQLDDPRRTVALVLAAARKRDMGDAATALEERANQIDSRGAAPEVAGLRLRAAQLAIDDGDAPRATRLLELVEAALPTLGVVPDLLAAARRRAGDRPSAAPRRTEVAPGVSTADAFARIVRDADLAATHGDATAAVALYQQALELRPGDPLATVPLVRVASAAGSDPDAVTALALAQLRAAEDSGDEAAKASAYELLAHVDGELRQQPASAQIALENAVAADPTRIDLRHRLERHYAAGDQLADLLRLRQSELASVAFEYKADRAALQLDLAGLAAKDGRSEDELANMYRAVLATDSKVRIALMHLESIVRRAGVTEELARLEEAIADYFDGDPKTQAAFWTRAGGSLAELGKIDEAVARFGRAEAALPGHVPALEGWQQAALKGQLWIDVAAASSRHAIHAPDASSRAALHHFAGVALMDKALEGEQAQQSFRRALEAVPGHKDSFLRLRILLEEDANHDDLATLLNQRLDVETDENARTDLHRALAELCRNFLSDRDSAKDHYRAILEADPNDLRAHAALADIAWELGNWQEAADELMARARLERQPEILRTLCFRLGLIYADRLVDVPMALKAFQRALTYEPDDEATLIRLADLAMQTGEWKLALGACERLVKNEVDPDRRASHLHRVAKIFKDGFGDTKRAERALNLALDGAPTNDEALQQVVQFYKDARDITSVRVHLNRVAGTMRARVQKDPQDGVGYRVISRAMSARGATGLAGSVPVARTSAEIAQLLGAAGEPEQKLLQSPTQPDLSLLMKADADELLFPRGAQLEIRQIFQLLGDRVAKHVGVDLRPYGVTRGDRLRARENPTATVAQSVASQMGFGEIDVYVSTKQPWAMVAEPTSPVSLILGSAIAQAGGDAIRFATGGALHLARVSLAIPARLPVEELGVLVIAMLRLFQPEFPMLAVDQEAVASQVQKLRRLIPTGLLNELKPFAQAIDPNVFGHRELARDLKIGSFRAGLVASGSLLAGLTILAGQVDHTGNLAGFLADPVAQGLITFALGEDYSAVAR